MDVKILVYNDLRKIDLVKYRFGFILKNIGSKIICLDNWVIYFCSFFVIELGNFVFFVGYVLLNYNVKFNYIDGCLFSMVLILDFMDIFVNGFCFVEFFG